MVESVGVPDRMRQARLQTAANRRAAVSQDEMAALVSKALGRVIRQTQWGRYETGSSEPPLDVIAATSEVSGLSREYLAFGDIDGNVTPEQNARYAASLLRPHVPVEEVEEVEVIPKPPPPAKKRVPVIRRGSGRGRRDK